MYACNQCAGHGAAVSVCGRGDRSEFGPASDPPPLPPRYPHTHARAQDLPSWKSWHYDPEHNGEHECRLRDIKKSSFAWRLRWTLHAHGHALVHDLEQTCSRRPAFWKVTSMRIEGRRQSSWPTARIVRECECATRQRWPTSLVWQAGQHQRLRTSLALCRSRARQDACPRPDHRNEVARSYTQRRGLSPAQSLKDLSMPSARARARQPHMVLTNIVTRPGKQHNVHTPAPGLLRLRRSQAKEHTTKWLCNNRVQ